MIIIKSFETLFETAEYKECPFDLFRDWFIYGTVLYKKTQKKL